MRKYIVYFLLGAYGYGLMEVVYRGFTHLTMLIAGGLCLCFIAALSNIRKIPFLIKVLISGGVITAVEFVFGYIFNVVMSMDIWDYSAQPFNILGQVCLKMTALWCGISAAALLLVRVLDVLVLRKGLFPSRVYMGDAANKVYNRGISN